MSLRISVQTLYYGVLLLGIGTCLVLVGCQRLQDPATPAMPAVSSSMPATSTGTGGGTPSSGANHIVDPLTGGTSVGIVSGGDFILGEGYHLPNNWGNYIAYETGISQASFQMEFDAKGYMSMEGDDADGKMVLFRLMDSPWNFAWAGHDQWQEGYSIFELRKKGRYYSDADGMHLKFGAGQSWEEYRSSEGHSPSGHPFAWDPNTTYHWTVIIQNNQFSITRNSQVVFQGSCPEFQLSRGTLNVLIGGAPGGASGPRDVTYSNVVIVGL